MLLNSLDFWDFFINPFSLIKLSKQSSQLEYMQDFEENHRSTTKSKSGNLFRWLDLILETWYLLKISGSQIFHKDNRLVKRLY